jgi:hypothetical protein
MCMTKMDPMAYYSSQSLAPPSSVFQVGDLQIDGAAKYKAALHYVVRFLGPEILTCNSEHSLAIVARHDERKTRRHQGLQNSVSLLFSTWFVTH